MKFLIGKKSARYFRGMGEILVQARYWQDCTRGVDANLVQIKKH